MFKNVIKQKIDDAKNDKYGLTRKIKVTDVKGYLQKEFDRAAKREQVIVEQEQKINELEKIKIQYDAMLVVQEKTQQRIEAQDQRIAQLKEDIEKRKQTEAELRAKITDIKVNAEQKLKMMRERAKKVKKG